MASLAIHQWKTMFLEISATFVYAMDLKKLQCVRGA